MDFVNSAVSRAYYAMFQAAQVALELEGMHRATWSHPGLQAAFTTELMHRRKRYAALFRDYVVGTNLFDPLVRELSRTASYRILGFSPPSKNKESSPWVSCATSNTG
jgi:uncharacterized protein (UPF0332 family)